MKPPSVGALRFLRGIRNDGFLDFIGAQWREHGDTFGVRLGPKSLVFAIHPDAVHRVNVSGRKHYDKRESYDSVRKYLLGEGLVVSTGDLWRRQRRLMAPFFTPKGIQTYADVMIRDSLQLAARWDGLARAGAEVEIAKEMTMVTASIILKAMFNAESDESIREMKDAVEVLLNFVDSKMTGLYLPLWVPTKKNRRYLSVRGFVDRTIRGLIAERRALPESEWPDDLLSRLMKARDEETGEAMSEGLLRDESITAYFAGHETTARTMTFAWYALATNPAVADQLHEELDRVLGGRTPTLEDLRQLPYTLRVVKEVLRLYPPAPMYARDTIEDDQLCGFEVRAGSAVMLSPFYTHRHPDFWDNPEAFDPDRWSPERSAGRDPNAYHPFAAGPRICIGNNFSLLESQILLAVLAQRFTPRLNPNYRARWIMRGTLGLADPLSMVLEARKPAA